MMSISKLRTVLPRRQQMANAVHRTALPILPRNIIIGSRRSKATSSASTSSPIKGEIDSSSYDEKERITTIRLYRILQRACQSFEVKESSIDGTNENGSDGQFLLQPILEAPDWGRHSTFTTTPSTTTEELFRLFYIWNDDAEDAVTYAPSSIDDWYSQVIRELAETSNDDDDDDDSEENNHLPPMTSLTCWMTTKQLQKAVRTAFRTKYNLDIKSLHRWTIHAIQMIHEQQTMWHHSSVATTEQIRVTATSRCVGKTVPSSSLPPAAMSGSSLDSKYRFAYRIRIENISSPEQPRYIQLLGRYWHIQEIDANGEPDLDHPPVIVDAPVTGAVGHLPVLRPGEVFEYMSGTELTTSNGIMSGHFYMVNVPSDAISAKSGDDIEALNIPDKLHVAVAPFPLIAS